MKKLNIIKGAKSRVKKKLILFGLIINNGDICPTI
jgi:hypothetical protein